MYKFILFSVLSLFSVSAFSIEIGKGNEFYEVSCKTDGNDSTSIYTLKNINYYFSGGILVITAENEKGKNVAILGKNCFIVEK